MDIQDLEKALRNIVGLPVFFDSKGYDKEVYFRILNTTLPKQQHVCRQIVRLEKKLNHEFIITPLFYTPEETIRLYPEAAMPQSVTTKNPLHAEREPFFDEVNAWNLEESGHTPHRQQYCSQT